MKTNNNQTLGIIILVIGTALLLKQIGIVFPGWLFTWPMILIVIGTIIGVKSGFRNPASLVLLIIGSFFVLKRNDILPHGLESYVLPVGLILLGLILLVGRKKKSIDWDGGSGGFGQGLKTGKSKRPQVGDPSDFINVEAIFCGIKRKNISKSFKGGEITTVFGGTDIDLSHADLEGTAVLDVSVAFGGIKLLVPSHWHVDFGVSNIAAGVEDKRYPNLNPTDKDKKLIITGTVVFGGIEVSSF